MSRRLDNIRHSIDALDDKIHDLLMERARLITRVGEEKNKSGVQIVEPAREATMIRRLMDRHEGILPRAAIIRMWREMVGAVSMLQTNQKVAVSAPEQVHAYWDMARDYFGTVLPMQKVANPLMAVAMVRDGEANFAVVPWPEDDNNNPWWTHLLSHNDLEQGIRIIAALPYGVVPQAQNPDFAGLVVARLGFDDSGLDRSFLMLEADADVSRAKIVTVLNKEKLTPLGIQSRIVKGDPSVQHLIEVDSYFAPDDERLGRLIANFGGQVTRCVCVGGYPVVPAYGAQDHRVVSAGSASGDTGSDNDNNSRKLKAANG